MNRFALLGVILWSVSPGLGHAGDGSKAVRVITNAKADAYGLVQGNHWMSKNMSLDDLHRLRRRFSGDFLWFRRDARRYLIHDKTFLLQAKGLFAPLRSLDPERAEVERRERALERKEEDFEREEAALDQIRDSFDDEDDEEQRRFVSESERRDLEHRQRELEVRRPALEEEEREVEALERSLEMKEVALERKAEEQLWKLIDQALASGITQPVTSGR